MSKLEKEIQTARSFENIMISKSEKQNKQMLFVTSLSIITAIVAMVALISLFPLKTTEIELWSVDAKTGRYEYMTRIKEKDISSQEALAKSLAATYVKAREGYNYFSLQEDYRQVKLMSSDEVKANYEKLFDSDNAPNKVYDKAKYFVKIDIITNAHSPATKPNNLANVRFKKTIRRISDGHEDVKIENARFTYQYLPRKELTDEQRESDPLGFVVTSWQVDTDLRSE